MKRWGALALPWLVLACIGSRASEVPRYHVLEPPDAATGWTAASPARDATLLVAPTTAVSFYDAREMAYGTGPRSRAYYQFNSWTEPPSRRVGALLLARLEAGRAFRTVAAATSGVRGTYVLSTHVVELYHDAAARPGVARATIAAELVDGERRELVARRTFSRSAPATSFDAAGAAQGLGQAVREVLDELVAWVDEVAPREPGPERRSAR
jgi:cholesterol transport system auxiliary component